MQEWGTPEALGELDRRIYDLAIQPMPLAEIAVRLGVPVGQADDRHPQPRVSSHKQDDDQQGQCDGGDHRPLSPDWG